MKKSPAMSKAEVEAELRSLYGEDLENLKGQWYQLPTGEILKVCYSASKESDAAGTLRHFYGIPKLDFELYKSPDTYVMFICGSFSTFVTIPSEELEQILAGVAPAKGNWKFGVFTRNGACEIKVTGKPRIDCSRFLNLHDGGILRVASVRSDGIDPRVVAADKRWRETSIRVRRGQREFRAALLEIYGTRCAFTGTDLEEALEAAHIVPYRKDEATNAPSNGILLRADIHTLFDLGLMAVDVASMSIVISPKLQQSHYAEFQGKKVYLPKKEAHRPRAEALEYHRKEAGL